MPDSHFPFDGLGVPSYTRSVMKFLLPRHCPSCGETAKYVWSPENLLRTVADVAFALFAFAPFDLRFQCPGCGTRFKAR